MRRKKEQKDRARTRSDDFPGKLWKGYVPRPLPEGTIIVPPREPAASVPVTSDEQLPPDESDTPDSD